MFNSYSDAIAKLAAEREGTFVSLSRPATTVSGPNGRPEPTTDNGQHFSAWGYWATANQLTAALCPQAKAPVLPDPGVADQKTPPAGDVGTIETIRREIVRKNELYFHRWRPQNVTYLFLFRKHEQGNNAVEIPQFDPLVDNLDARINAAKKALPAAVAVAHPPRRGVSPCPGGGLRRLLGAARYSDLPPPSDLAPLDPLSAAPAFLYESLR